MLKNRKWDNEKGRWRFPGPKQYRPKIKIVWVTSEKGFFNKEKGEKGYWQNIFDGFEMGPQLYPSCQLCGQNLDEIRSAAFPAIPRYAEKFCSKNHMIEYSKRK